jgi:hypothetical protein
MFAARSWQEMFAGTDTPGALVAAERWHEHVELSDNWSRGDIKARTRRR